MSKGINYGLITRIKVLRDLLRQGECTKAEICHHLPQYYQSDSSGNRRLGRDINALRQLGYLISVDRTTHTYSIQETSFLDVSDEQVRALALVRETFETLTPVSLEILSVLDRIIAALPEAQRDLYNQHSPISIRMNPAADYRPHLKIIRTLEAAVKQGRKVRFVYPSLAEDNLITHIGVEPYEIQFFDRHFYLLGFTPHDPQMMEFRIDRMRDIEIMTGRAVRYRSRKTLPFTYRLSPRIARLGISERFLKQKVTLQEDGSAIIHAEGYSEFRIVQELLRYGEQAELLGPANLRAHMLRVVEAMLFLYTHDKDK